MPAKFIIRWMHLPPMTRPAPRPQAAKCPLCGAAVAGGVGAMNKHFEGECTSVVTGKAEGDA